MIAHMFPLALPRKCNAALDLPESERSISISSNTAGNVYKIHVPERNTKCC